MSGDANECVHRRVAILGRHLSASTAVGSIERSTTSASTDVSEEQLGRSATLTPGGETLEHERSRASFDVDVMAALLANDPTGLLRTFKQAAAEAIATDEVLAHGDHPTDQPRARLREHVWQKIRQTVEMRGDRDHSGGGANNKPKRERNSEGSGSLMAEAFYDVMTLYDSSWSTRIGVHYGLFGSTILSQGSRAQVDEWSNAIENMHVTGCFALTELGHGSFVRGVETLATYDRSAEEFVIHSPTITSTKWWIGMAGQTATHSVVYARLVLDGKDVGVHNFIVPLRDPKTGRLCHGIEAGDCGSKMGRQGLDNGWLRFNHARIPRKNMLCRWSQVAADGTYTPAPKRELSYGSLTDGRVALFHQCSLYVQKAVTIATRYSAIRQQGPSLDASVGEENVINYQNTYHRLADHVATTFAVEFSARRLSELQARVKSEMDKTGRVSRELGALHASSAGLKAFGTWWASGAIEQCRQMLGGHGYSHYTEIASTIDDFGVMVTWEGDNTILSLQTARALVGAVKKMHKGERPTGALAYLGDSRAGVTSLVKNRESLDDLSVLLELSRCLTRSRVLRTAARVAEEKRRDNDKHLSAWNKCAVELVLCARLHTYLFMLQCFVDVVENLTAEQREGGVAPVLERLARLFALRSLERHTSEMVRAGLVRHGDQLDWLESAIRETSAELRPDLIGLTDSFELPDLVLGPFGRHDGNIYEEYFNCVRRAPGAMGVAPYWRSEIAPFLNPS